MYQALLDVHDQQHLWVNMAADRKAARAGKIHLDRLARRLLVRIEAHVARVDIDLMEKFIVIGEQHSVAAGDRDLAGGLARIVDVEEAVRGIARVEGKP